MVRMGKRNKFRFKSKYVMNNLINWSEVSRLLTSDRTNIRADYNGKKYHRKIERLKKLVNLWVWWQEKQK